MRLIVPMKTPLRLPRKFRSSSMYTWNEWQQNLMCILCTLTGACRSSFRHCQAPQSAEPAAEVWKPCVRQPDQGIMLQKIQGFDIWWVRCSAVMFLVCFIEQPLKHGLQLDAEIRQLTHAINEMLLPYRQLSKEIQTKWALLLYANLMWMSISLILRRTQFSSSRMDEASVAKVTACISTLSGSPEKLHSK